MIGKRTAIWKREEYSYESEERDIPYVISYMHEDGQIRPAMIVVPGVIIGRRYRRTNIL